MPRPYTPLALANWFIERATPFGVTHMKLQKLVYCAHGWWLAFNDTPIVSERPEVWRHGPVFPSLYNRLAGFGLAPITTKQTDVFTRPPPEVDDVDYEVLQLLDFIKGRYGAQSALRLSDLTHKKGTPWQIMAERYNYRVPPHLDIPDELVRNEFQRIAQSEGLLVEER